MRHTIGVLAAERVAAGVVGGDRVAGTVYRFPGPDQPDALHGMPAEHIADCVRDQVRAAAAGGDVGAIGVAVPGIIRDGIIEESPNFTQMKGMDLRAPLAAAFPGATVLVFNDADAVAAGIAATLGHLDRLVRVWTLGAGIGYGRYPRVDGIWEGGHCVVTLDPKERFCGCGGAGHLEGILGDRAMRLRFLEIDEPAEIFENAQKGDERCRTFVKLWHRALAAATASSIHLDGPGKFYISGHNARFVDSALLNLYLHEMVKMSTLQGSFTEVIDTTDEIAIIGAAINAEKLASRP